MNLIVALIFSLSSPSQIRVGNTNNFVGFVPDKETAAAVASPILRKIMGSEYMDLFNPITAADVTSVEGRWVIHPHEKPSKIDEDISLEPIVMAIDPWSGRIPVFGLEANTNMPKLLKQFKADKPLQKAPKPGPAH